jgi:hypothetical protein
MPPEDGLGVFALDLVDLKEDLEAVVLGVLFQEVIQGCLDHPAPGFLDIGEWYSSYGGIAERRRSGNRNPRLQLPLVPHFSGFLGQLKRPDHARDISRTEG